MPAIIANELQDMQLRSAHVTDEVSAMHLQITALYTHVIFSKLISYVYFFAYSLWRAPVG